MDTPVIEARGLVKTFGPTAALDGFDLTVAPGQVAGFLGPNGSGKSTAIRVLLGLLRADAGTATVLGLDAWRDAVQIHRRTAYVPGDTNLWPNLTGGEIVDLLTGIRGGRRRRRRRDELVERFELDPTKKARSYSKGNRQKVALVAALSAEAELYVLDEPTSGLDPLMEAVFTDEVRRLSGQGSTVLLSSHILAEVEKLCDTVTIIRAGRDVESGTLAQLRHLTRSAVTATTSAGPGRLGGLPGVHHLVHEDGRLSFDVDDARVPEVLRALADLGVQNLTVTPPSLEELFLRHYGDRPVEPAAPDGTGRGAGRDVRAPR
ncbi:ABC transporter ATP-binding protein [Kocuria rosea]|uniref:ABC transporter ATP-binding protein n=1 Tax=Kocuria rosea subsp. polaris TaxID=136273 RepID=A0A0A6Y9Z5_KOCRO|nr:MULTISPECIES: ABC transporter ATP-binding protein [Kocuria]KHD96222.1 ABC transporter ATP-binding protein [Kocuria polaris]PWF83086.1 ABC transporter ATP-binding protein [Kocuria rosea]PWF86671.1 ABC transporter ATP-binding protein [Kocuria rosea]QCY32155.1 ABC transporter ATP-binding protein [Kocuria rosea]THE17169.1 ABC transporter ATP-binding protein [Kocuria rosea]